MRLLPLLLCLLAAPLSAGLWDRDRPADDRVEDVMSTLAGRFDRPAPAYYEARYARLKPLLDAPIDKPEDLAVFNDAGVALAKLGRYAEAIILIDRGVKASSALTPAEASRATRPLLANKAGVLMLRHIAEGAGANGLEQAKALLDKLIQQDPYDTDSIFTRRELEWRMSSPADSAETTLFPNMLGITAEQLRRRRDQGSLAGLGLAGAIAHLSRRIVHGGGWANVDVAYALSLALWVEGRDEEAATAWLRVSELLASGARSAIKHALEPEGLIERMGAHLGDVPQVATQQAMFREMRQAADRWVEQRNQWLQDGIAQGRHPDTHADFWAGFGEDPIPQAGDPPPESAEPPVSTTFVVGGVSALAVLLFVLGGFALFVGRRHPRPPTVDEV